MERLTNINNVSYGEYIANRVPNIQKVTEQLCYSTKNLNEMTNVELGILFDNITVILNMWVGDLYVGVPKETNIKNAFQLFFQQFYKILLKGKYSSNEKMKKLANKCLYKGVLYRYIGYCGVDGIDKPPIEPIYNDIWVSWSKQDVRNLPYLHNKFYGTKTLLICNTIERAGIDIAEYNKIFDIGRITGKEVEVVYPTLKDTIKSVDYIK